MLFNSYEFLYAFFPAVLCLFYILANLANSNYRRHLIIAASLIFYSSWDIWNLPVILVSMTVNYGISLKMRDAKDEPDFFSEKFWLVLGIIFNLSLLGYYKYFNFLIGIFNSLFGASFHRLDIVLPLGISFFTFQQIIYLCDLRRRVTAPANPIDYAVCVSFFPHLIAGPIIKYRKILPQLSSPIQFKVHTSYLAAGLGFLTIGLLKKVLLADNLAPIADDVFKQALHHGPMSMIGAWAGAMAYTLQIYFDFSGYSDMAVGLGLCFGIELPVNFNSPYKSRSIIDFWRCWHITLSQFLRDYLYIPLGGNRNGKPRHYLNLLITMFLGGLWHGAGWTFIFWGILHGGALCLNHWWHGLRQGKMTGEHFLTTLLARAATFAFLLFTWVVFRADNLSNAFHIWRAMISSSQDLSFSWPLSTALWLALCLGIALFPPNTQEIMNHFRSRFELYSPSDFKTPRYMASAKWGLAMGLAFFGVSILISQATKFLYFDF
jgi:D-alanyl-lipoteichoic acid acyltransferase DltB (MBOAT superfamily)